jgi:hypothetical protein
MPLFNKYGMRRFCPAHTRENADIFSEGVLNEKDTAECCTFGFGELAGNWFRKRTRWKCVLERNETGDDGGREVFKNSWYLTASPFASLVSLPAHEFDLQTAK